MTYAKGGFLFFCIRLKCYENLNVVRMDSEKLTNLKGDVPIVLSKWYAACTWILEKVDSFPKNQRFIFGTRLAEYPRQLRMSLLGRIQVERPDLFEKLQKQEKQYFQELQKQQQKQQAEQPANP